MKLRKRRVDNNVIKPLPTSKGRSISSKRTNTIDQPTCSCDDRSVEHELRKNQSETETDIPKKIKQLSEARRSVRVNFEELNQLIQREISEKSSKQFITLLIDKMKNINDRSNELTKEISALLEMSDAQIDLAIQANYDRNLDQIKTNCSDYLNSIADCAPTYNLSSKRRRTDEVSNDDCMSSFAPSIKPNYFNGNEITDSEMNPLANKHTEQMLNNPIYNSPSPDGWIDSYVNGFEQPRRNNKGKTELEKYNGSSLKWFEWIGMVQALVHDTPLSPAEKLAKLKHSLTGKCSDIIQGIGGGEIAYKEVLKRLKEKCGNREVMKAAHLTYLDNLIPGKTQNDFVKFTEHVRSHLFALNQLEGPSSNPSLIYKICSKLRRSTLVSWNKNPLSKRNNLNDFGIWLYEEAVAGNNPYEIGKEDAIPLKSTSRRIHTAFSQHHENSTERIKCLFCSKKHHVSRCSKFLRKDLNQRIKFLAEVKACNNCLNRGHNSKDCKIKKQCKFSDCIGKHHLILHRSTSN